jgi:hypothetical protein
MLPAPTPSRLRSILLIISLLGLILTSIFLNRRSLYEIQQASASIYQDRLVPSGILVNLTSVVYQKRLALEAYARTTSQPEEQVVFSTLDRLNRRLDSLLTEFERTRLTSREADQLQLLKQQLFFYSKLEAPLMTTQTKATSSQPVILTSTGNTAFWQIAQTLEKLSTLQLNVGEELVSGSRGKTNYSYVLTALQTGLVLMIVLSLFWHRF